MTKKVSGSTESRPTSYPPFSILAAKLRFAIGIRDGSDEGWRCRLETARGLRKIDHGDLARGLGAIFGDEQRALLFLREVPVVFDSSADRLRKFFAPGRIGNAFAVAGLGEESALDQNGGDFRMAQDGETRALYPAIKFRDVAEHGMIDGRGKLEALRVDRAAGLHVDEAEGERVVGGGRSAARRERKNFEAGRVAGRIGSVKMKADEDGIARGVRDAGAHFERDEDIVLARHDHAKTFR